MQDVKWFIGQGLRLTDPSGPVGILDALNDQALPGYTHFSTMLMDFWFGVDSPDQSDEVLFLAHFMWDIMDPDDRGKFANQVVDYGHHVKDFPSPISFFDASVLVGVAAITQNPKWIDIARQAFPHSFPGVKVTDIYLKHGALALLRYLRALRFIEPHRIIESSRELADYFIAIYLSLRIPVIIDSRLLHLCFTTLGFLPRPIKENMAWVISKYADEIALAGHQFMMSSAVLINSNWDEITPTRPE